MAWKDWVNAIKETNEIHKREGFLGKGRSDYNWCPSNWENVQNNPHCEDYKNLFVKLRFNGHYHSNHDFEVIRRFEQRYKSDENLRKKIARYLELTELNYRPITKNTWDNPFGTFKMQGPTYKGKKYGFIPSFEKTELGIEYDNLEFELKQEFNKI